MLSILLVQHALAPGITEANMRSRLPGRMDGNQPVDAGALPYLKITGALALRFNAPPPPPDLTTKPAASAPPFPLPSTPAASAPDLPPAPIAAAAKPVEPTTPSTPPAPVINNPTPTILPDDTRPSTRPEDFLPFFQFPGSTGDVSVPVPPPVAHPGQLPPSSATYQQR